MSSSDVAEDSNSKGKTPEGQSHSQSAVDGALPTPPGFQDGAICDSCVPVLLPLSSGCEDQPSSHILY